MNGPAIKRTVLLVSLWAWCFASATNAQTDRSDGRVLDTVAHSFSVTFNHENNLVYEGVWTALSGTIHNLTDHLLSLKFYRTHIRIPDGWASYVRIGDLVYSPKVDSMPAPVSFPLTTDTGGAIFMLYVYCDPHGLTEDSLVDYIRFAAEGESAADTASLAVAGVFELPSTVATDHSEPRLLPGITAAYPSPVCSGAQVRFRIETARARQMQYEIFDAMGRSLGRSAASRQLSIGANLCEIGGLGSYSNGTYTIRFSFADGTSDSRMFQIMR